MEKNEKDTVVEGHLSSDRTEDEIVSYINSLKFKKRFFGGVDEADVWEKIRELNALYEKKLILERASSAKPESVPADKNE